MMDGAERWKLKRAIFDRTVNIECAGGQFTRGTLVKAGQAGRICCIVQTFVARMMIGTGAGRANNDQRIEPSMTSSAHLPSSSHHPTSTSGQFRLRPIIRSLLVT